jgi:hypothetical protein
MMKLDLKLPIVIFAASVLVMLTGACGAKKQNENEAFELVKADKLLKNDSDVVNKAMLPDSKKLETDKRIVYVNEQAKYKTDTEKQILLNQNVITALKNSANTKLGKGIARLEKENDEIRKQLDKYDQDMKWKWIEFKANTDRSLHEMDVALKELALKAKK